ncbi:MAG: 3-phosphoglycerate dehydrogenase [Clostridia bacterium]|jgi:D-3-phosphoglycerate dehydrogenase|nr:3-phosphoglycerate dehydrogenase [Clostridia bacterium]MBQ2254911.1 3-phosphoglycerate dehydrogenase [Clostridia bacterium]
MKNIQLLNSISDVGLEVFDKAAYNLGTDVENPAGILVRSAVMHDMQFPASLCAIARAGAGVNNIPLERCAEEGIVVFNTPGANANGVKELALLALLLASRKVVAGIEWAKTLKGDPELSKKVEKGKSQFVGPEVKGKTLGVIGLGAIGGMVANAGDSLGMNVIGCDPFLSVKAAWSLKNSVHSAADYDEIYANSDYITYHIPALPTTKGIINKENIAKMKDGVRIINLSRGDLANVADVAEALKSGKIASYVTDFPAEELLGLEGAVCIPHLGASTPESEDNCAKMAAEELIDFLENGNITNSVNFPGIHMPRIHNHRLVVLHRNVPGVVNAVSGALAIIGVNIEAMANQSKGNYAVSMFDFGNEISEDLVEKVASMENILRVSLK